MNLDRCRFCEHDSLIVLSLVSPADDLPYSNEVVYCDHCGREYERTSTGVYVR